MFPSRSILFIWIYTTLIGLSSAAILSPSRSLSKEKLPAGKTRMQLIKERDDKLNEAMRRHYRQTALDNFDQCFSYEAIRANRPDNHRKKPTDKDRDEIAAGEWAKFQTGCFYTYFKNKATGDEHINLSTKDCSSGNLFAFLQSNKLVSDACFNFAKAIKSYGLFLGSLNQSWAPKDDVEMYYKTFYFSWAERSGENQKLTSKADLPELISKTVVSIHQEQRLFKAERFTSGDGSGNLVDFDPATKTVKNICEDGKDKATLNFLLTAAHCMKELDEKLVRAKVRLPDVAMLSPVALVSMDTYFEANLDKSNMRKVIMESPYIDNWENINLKPSVPLVEAGIKKVGEDVFIDLFQDKDTILVKLAKPVEIACPAGKSIDFGHANPNQAIREKMVEAVQKQETSMGLYGFPGGFGPFRIKMHPLKYDVLFPELRPENYLDNLKENHERRVRKFILSGAALNGASGGPLFLEDGGKVAYIGTVIRGETNTIQGLSTEFNVRKLE